MRDLVRGQLVEISLVAIPAYSDAVVYELGGRPVDREVPTFNLPDPTPMPDLSWINKPPPKIDLTPLPKALRW